MLKLESIFLLRHRGEGTEGGGNGNDRVSLSLFLSDATRQQAWGGGKFWRWRGWMALLRSTDSSMRLGFFRARKEFLLGRVISDISCSSYRWFFEKYFDISSF